jgi:hypothetical protein
MEKLTDYEHYPVPEAGRTALLAAKKRILEEVRRLNMRFWFRKAGEPGALTTPPCGIVACLAGNLCLATDQTLPLYVGVPRRAAEILGVPLAIAERLFYVGDWPRPFGSYYRWDDRPEAARQNAQLVASLIDYVLEYGIPFALRCASEAWPDWPES